MRDFLPNIRLALRFIRRNPGFATVAIGALALGIGANSAMFSVVNALLIRPLPYADADRIGIVWEKSAGQGWSRINPSGPDYVDWKEHSRSTEEFALLEPGSGTVTGFGEPQQVPGMRVTTNTLHMLGVKPFLGRDFRPAEGFKDRVGILSYGMWMRWSGGDPGIVGRRVITDGIPYTIIGILPPGAWFPVPTDVLVPWEDKDLRYRNRMDHSLVVLAKRKAGISWSEVSAELDTIQRRIGDSFPRMKGWGAYAAPFQAWLVQNARPGLLMLLGAVGLVLLIACTNIANLLLARAVARGREVAVRAALGAPRRKLLQQFLTEAMVLGVIGGAVGLVLAVWGIDALDKIVPATIRVPDSNSDIIRPPLTVDGTVFLFTFGVSILTGLLFGLAPALTAIRGRAQEALRDRSRSSGSGSHAKWIRNGLVVSEIALALVLLIAASMTIESIWKMQQVNPGFSTTQLLVMETELPTDSKYKTDPEEVTFFRQVLDRIHAIPGVSSAAIGCSIPMDEEDHKTDFVIEGRPLPPSGQLLPANYRMVSEDYFSALRIPLKRGRLLTEQDDANHPRVILIDEEMAARYWPAGSEGAKDPIGQRIRLRGAVAEIVGIVGAVKHSGLDKKPEPTIYSSYRQDPENHVRILVRHAAPSTIVNSVKAAIYSVDKDQPVFKIRTMDDIVSGSQQSSRFASGLLAAFAIVALTLASLGIYGVISYAVAQRTNEIGIRIALGAASRDVLRMVVGEGALLAGAGLAVGVAAALAVTRVLSSLLFGVSASDPYIFAGMAIVLGAVAVAASYLPARRASKIDPAISLRCE
jgi:putative ABC transport system permease protein